MMAEQTSTLQRPVAGARVAVGSGSQLLIALVLALVCGAASLALAFSQADPTEAAEGRLLSLLVAGVVACAAVAAQLGGGRWLTVPAVGAVLALTCLWMLHQGPQRGAAVAWVLVVTLAASLARAWQQTGEGAWGPSITWATSLAVGMQWLLRPDLLLPPVMPTGPLLYQGILLPAGFGILVGVLAGGLGRPALLVGVAVLIGGPGVDAARMTVLVPALLLTLGGVALWRQSGFGLRPALPTRLETLAARSLLVVGAMVVLPAAYPYLHPSPWSGLARLAMPARTAAVPLDHGVVALQPNAPVWHHQLATPVVAAALVLDASLVHGLDATGEVVATALAFGVDGRVVGQWPLVGGIDTADWAADRPDVRAREGFRAPPAFYRYVPPGGGFLANRYRVRLTLEAPREISAVEVRLATPPSGVRPWELHLVRAELRR